MKLTVGFVLAVTTALVVAAGLASGATLTNDLGTLSANTVVSGMLGSEADVQLEDFTLLSNNALTIFSTSYAGGVNLDGTNTTAGGFQPNVALWTSSGSILDQTTGSFPGNAGDPNTGIVGDTLFTTLSLPAGNYVLSIANWATTGNPVNGFVDTGSGSFEDVGGNPRSGDFTVDIASTATPEPASVWLLLSAAVLFLGFGLNRKRPARSSQHLARELMNGK